MTKVLTVRIEEDALYRDLGKVAKLNGRSMNMEAQMALDAWVEKQLAARKKGVKPR